MGMPQVRGLACLLIFKTHYLVKQIIKRMVKQFLSPVACHFGILILQEVGCR